MEYLKVGSYFNIEDILWVNFLIEKSQISLGQETLLLNV
jgi:hypothetical protein